MGRTRGRRPGRGDGRGGRAVLPRQAVPRRRPFTRGRRAARRAGAERRLTVPDNPAMVDWGAGRYEKTAAELEPVARAVVELAAVAAGERVVDLACGTGNAALIAAEHGARTVGVDAAPRLLDV